MMAVFNSTEELKKRKEEVDAMMARREPIEIPRLLGGMIYACDCKIFQNCTIAKENRDRERDSGGMVGFIMSCNPHDENFEMGNDEFEVAVKCVNSGQTLHVLAIREEDLDGIRIWYAIGFYPFYRSVLKNEAL